jgi:hypothetical protein
MSRRAAAITQADVARAGRAARQLGPEWCVEIVGSVIRLTRSPTKGRLAELQSDADPAEEDGAAEAVEDL